jgi:trimeric autotransporter adhesin
MSLQIQTDGLGNLTNTVTGEGAAQSPFTADPSDARFTGGLNVISGDNALNGSGAPYQFSTYSVVSGKNAARTATRLYCCHAVGERSMEMAGDNKIFYATAYGATTLRWLSSGNENVAVGAKAGMMLQAGYGNTLLGTSAGQDGTTYNNVVAIGASTALNNKADGLTAVGTNAAKFNVSGLYKTAVGYKAGEKSTGNGNTDVGYLSGAECTTGEYNVGVGRKTNALNTTGSYRTAIGDGALQNADNYSFVVGMGWGAEPTNNWQIRLGSAYHWVYSYNAVQTVSDERDKTDFRPLKLGVDFLKRIEVVEYRNKPRAIHLPDGAERIEGRRYHTGVKAQQVAQVCKDLGVDFSGLQHHEQNGGADVWTVAYEKFIPILIKAVQDQEAEIESLKKYFLKTN